MVAITALSITLAGLLQSAVANQQSTIVAGVATLSEFAIPSIGTATVATFLLL